MQIQENISLKGLNTFGIDVKARHFVSVASISELKQVLAVQKDQEWFFLGGGSNMLLTDDIDALVIHLDMKGISVLSETDSHVIVKASAGENWHEFVIWCLERDYGGLENLSLIPGNVGTSPIQNIGAYGVELKDHMVSCDVIEVATLSQSTIANEECMFEYRDSIFKGKDRGKYIITDVTFTLTKKAHKIHDSYGAIGSELKARNISKPTIQDISEAVIAIRQSKLPDPKVIGNSGSFFKNPIVSIDHLNVLKTQFSDVPNYPVSETECKVPAGWLIEQAGFKGKRFNEHGVHDKQALVLVNHGNASGKDILDLARLIQHTVRRIFGISLETEVNIF